MWCYKALALLAALGLELLVAVQSCGHHIVHGQIQDLAARHVEQQLHMGSASWGLRTASRTEKVQANTQNAARTRQIEMAGADAHGHVEVYSKDEASSTEDIHMDAATTKLQQWQEDRATSNVGWRTTAVSDVGDGVQEDGTDPRDEAGEEESTLDPRGRSLQQTPAPAPIRLSVTYQQLGALDASQQQRLTRVVEAVRRILQKFILVKQPSSGGMLVDPYCNLNTWACYPDFSVRMLNPNRICGLAIIMPEHIVNPFSCTTRTTNAQRQALGRGISGPASGAGGGASGYGTGCASYAGTKGDDTDMYLYITAVPNNDCNIGAAAWAKPCLLDLGNNRPLLGAANVCPRALEVLDEEQLTAVLTHEMIHALGFTDSMYNLTRRPDGTLRPLSELVQSSMVGTKRVQMLVSPNVRNAARAQFKCPDLAGAQLEEEGSAGSAGSHWEYTHYQGEVMVASTTFATDGTPPVLSNLTLSYLDDTGWYATNRSAAGLLSWGAGAGCQLPSSPCSTYMSAVPGQRLFCDASAVQSNSIPTFLCSNNYKATGVCRALNFTGGCGLVLSRNAKETCLTADAPNDQPAVFGWGLGTPSGRCFPVVYRFQAYVGYSRYTYPGTGLDGSSDAACFDTTCSADGSKVFVKLLSQQFECPEGQYLNLAQLLPTRYSAGRIGPCPSARDLCSTQSCPVSACNPAGGECLDGTCYCRLAYTGADCGISLITGQAVTDSDSNGASSGGNGTGNMSPSQLPWVQLVQLALSMNNSASEVKAQSLQLQAVIASWAGLNRRAVVITNIFDGTRDALSSGNGTVAGDSFDATVASRRRRGLLQTSSPPPSPPAAAAIAMVLISPTSSRPIEMLLWWLKYNQTTRNQLISQLADAGFYVIPNGISVESILAQSMVTSPASSESLATSNPSMEADSSHSRKIVIVGLAIGAVAVLGIISGVITVLVLRSRRSASRARENVYQHSPVAAGGDLGGGDGFTNLGAFTDGVVFAGSGNSAPQPQPYSIGSSGVDMHSNGVLPWPSANPFTAHGNGSWPTAQQASTPDNAFGFYNAQVASQASSQPPPLQQQQSPFSTQAGGMGQLSPLYSGTDDRLRS